MMSRSLKLTLISLGALIALLGLARLGRPIIFRYLERHSLVAAQRLVREYLEGKRSLDSTAVRLEPGFERYGQYLFLPSPLPPRVRRQIRAVNIYPTGWP